jgi:hypothetical protein
MQEEEEEEEMKLQIMVRRGSLSNGPLQVYTHQQISIN